MADKRASWKPWVNKKKLERQEGQIQQLERQLAREKAVRAQEELEHQQRQRQERERELDQRRRLERQLAQEKADRAQQELERQEKERQEKERKERDKRNRDEKWRKLQMISPETLRGLRELIRTRYELDVEIWSLRKVRKPDRGIVEEKMEKADAVLLEILTIVHAWEGTESSWTEPELKQVREIQRRILADGKRWWVGNPPWEDD